MNDPITTGFALLLVILVPYACYRVGCAVGEHRQRKLWAGHMDKCNRYVYAVDDLDKWCGHQSPHARLIARHLKAHGEGLGYNAGTPTGDEACDVAGLRQQLERTDAAIRAEGTHQ